MQAATKSLIGALKAIPVFKVLSPSQVKSLLRICDNREIEEGFVLCQKDSSGEECMSCWKGDLPSRSQTGH